MAFFKALPVKVGRSSSMGGKDVGKVFRSKIVQAGSRSGVRRPVNSALFPALAVAMIKELSPEAGDDGPIISGIDGCYGKGW